MRRGASSSTFSRWRMRCAQPIRLSYHPRLVESSIFSRCRVSGVPAGRECSEKLWRVGNNGCKALLTRNRGENLRVVGIHSDG